jgi:hypothetical protein
MAVETLGEALSYGWRVTARCAHGRRDGMKSIKECVYRAELDMETLVWTRGRSFPLSRLETRLRCPMCGSRDVRLIFTVPREAQTARGAKSAEMKVEARIIIMNRFAAQSFVRPSRVH